MDYEKFERDLAKALFDSTRLAVIPGTDVKKANKQSPEFNEKLIKVHSERFDQIVTVLEEDFKDTGMQLTFSSRILINQVAMNMITLEKVLLQSQIIFLVDVIHKDIVLVKKELLMSEYTPMNKEYNIHPYFEKLYFRLQDQINAGLKKLGLLPMQQIEKQKLTIIRKLKQRFEEIDKEYSVKAEKEVLTPKKRVSENPEEKIYVEADK